MAVHLGLPRPEPQTLAVDLPALLAVLEPPAHLAGSCKVSPSLEQPPAQVRSEKRWEVLNRCVLLNICWISPHRAQRGTQLWWSTSSPPPHSAWLAPSFSSFDFNISNFSVQDHSPLHALILSYSWKFALNLQFIFNCALLVCVLVFSL